MRFWMISCPGSHTEGGRWGAISAESWGQIQKISWISKSNISNAADPSTVNFTSLLDYLWVSSAFKVQDKGFHKCRVSTLTTCVSVCLCFLSCVSPGKGKTQSSVHLQVKKTKRGASLPCPTSGLQPNIWNLRRHNPLLDDTWKADEISTLNIYLISLVPEPPFFSVFFSKIRLVLCLASGEKKPGPGAANQRRLHACVDQRLGDKRYVSFANDVRWSNNSCSRP